MNNNLQILLKGFKIEDPKYTNNKSLLFEKPKLPKRRKKTRLKKVYIVTGIYPAFLL